MNALQSMYSQKYFAGTMSEKQKSKMLSFRLEPEFDALLRDFCDRTNRDVATTCRAVLIMFFEGARTIADAEKIGAYSEAERKLSDEVWRDYSPEDLNRAVKVLRQSGLLKKAGPTRKR